MLDSPFDESYVDCLLALHRCRVNESGFAITVKVILNYIELFAGCGGLSVGLESEGFDLVFANELSPMAAETYAFNLLGPSFEAWGAPGVGCWYAENRWWVGRNATWLAP